MDDFTKRTIGAIAEDMKALADKHGLEYIEHRHVPKDGVLVVELKVQAVIAAKLAPTSGEPGGP